MSFLYGIGLRASYGVTLLKAGGVLSNALGDGVNRILSKDEHLKVSYRMHVS